MDDRFSDRVSLITGAGSGIGRAMWRWRARAWSSPTSTRADADDTASVIGDSAIGVSVDISDEASVTKLVQHGVDAFGRIDVLCNNAGVPGPISLPAALSIADWERVLRINLTGTFLVTHVAPHARPGPLGHRQHRARGESAWRCGGIHLIQAKVVKQTHETQFQ